MSSSTKVGGTKTSSLLRPEVFKERLNFHLKVAKELDAIRREISKTKDKKVEKEGKVYTNKTVTTELNKNNKQLSKLAGEYRKAYSRAKADRLPNVNSSFNRPVKVLPVLVNFFAKADLGTLPNQEPLQNLLAGTLLGGNNLASRSILSSLLAHYAKRHELFRFSDENRGKPLEQMNRQVLGVDDYMNRTLGPIFDALETQSQADLKAKGIADGQQKQLTTKRGNRKFQRADGSKIWNDYEHAFRRTNFSYSNFQSIFAKAIQSLDDQKDASGKVVNHVWTVEPTVGHLYVLEVTKATDSGVLGTPGNTFEDIANKVSKGIMSNGLRIRAALDQTHANLVSLAAHNKSSTTKPRKSKK